jgi:hypothetical protein
MTEPRVAKVIESTPLYPNRKREKAKEDKPLRRLKNRPFEKIMSELMANAKKNR